MAAKAGQRKRPPEGGGQGRQRLWLVLFAAAFVVIFVIFAVAQGIGAESVPSGDAAIVRGGPQGDVTISEAEVEKGIEQQIGASESESKGKPPKPGSKKYEELQEAAFQELLQLIWIRGQAEEEGVTATPKQIEQELAQIKKTNFPTPKSYKEFLEKTQFTQEDVNARVEQQILGTEIQEKAKGEAPVPTQEEIQAYYDQEKAKQFTTPASRDVRLIVNKDKAKVEAAAKILEADNSPKSWKEAAAKYSSDPTTKTTGGLQKGITEEFVKGPLKVAIFDGATGELSGVIPFQKNYLLVEPVKINPEGAKTLAEVRAQISETLSAKKNEEFFAEYVSDFDEKWTARTFCDSQYATANCANFKGTGRPEGADPACYEADPKKPPTECPSPVTPTKPALPGTVTKDKPKGEQFVQRPLPEATKAAKKGASALPEGVEEAPTGE